MLFLIILFVLYTHVYSFLPRVAIPLRSSLPLQQTKSPTPTTTVDYTTFVKEILEIITSTGIKTGFKRTVEAAFAVDKLLIDIFTNPSNYQTDKKEISLPKILKGLFTKLGATYIKLGQFIASSPTLFPADFVLEFQSCLDKGPTVPFSDIKRIIESDLKQPLTSIFESVDPVPLASASIAQVHKAILKNGTQVVIKVRKPDVETSLKADLGFLYINSKILELISPDLSRLSVSAIIGDLRSSMLDELDFNKEAQNLLKFREFLSISSIQDATAPFPYVEYTSKQVMVMEYLKGVPLVDLEGIQKYSSNPEATLISALRTWALSVANNEFYHADVHAGNLLVLEDGRVAFIDFGIVGRISETVWGAMGKLVESFVAEDYQGIASALVSMGATSATVDVVKFGNELREVIESIANMNPQIILESYENGAQMDARINIDERETTKIVLDIVAVAERNGLKLPREFGLLLKQALYFDRYQKLLAPTLDPLRDSRVRESLRDELGGAGGRPQRMVIDVEKLGEK